MNPYATNTLHIVSPTYTWEDYHAFNRQLQLPFLYLRVAFSNYNPAEAVKRLPEMFRQIHTKLWENRVTTSMTERMYQVANIPPQYHRPTEFTCAKAADQDTLQYLIENVCYLKENGKLFYFYGPFCAEPLKAATTIAKKAVDNKIKCYCNSYPEFLEIIKTWDVTDERLKMFRNVPILILWAVGSEWSTEFTTTQLDALINTRNIHNLTTILVSSLSPKEYADRYGAEPQGIIVGFKGTKVKETLEKLREEMSRG